MEKFKILTVQEMKQVNGGGQFSISPIAVGKNVWEFGKGFVKGWNKAKSTKDLRFH
ncbi:bacteriocin [Enterococcus pallens]|uniref:Bacteriocin-type signal sequence n=1 Tax=Enterococcus pallens ATCC BAA-351 TaxID=1158607 RepID=R2SSG8_9ENTE|nr:bacteriocin [Enterococcus pallens]EOH91019.1 bacteriocin-type signal sequence [Enterococcus pallens ATCC BAA-351]EOU16215.1 hypothetical protein I588_03871 [Enterococcus pallens ATCC BAA-351]OJG79044.1 bacteriocin-type signal sequence [Enterococcus pallens]